MKYFTWNTPLYRPYAEALEASAKKLGLEFTRIETDPQGNWHYRMCQRTYVIRDYLKTLKDGDEVIWLDSDIEFLSFQPDFKIPEGVDFASVVYPHAGRNSQKKFKCCIMYFKVSPNIIRFLNEWIKESEYATSVGLPEETEYSLCCVWKRQPDYIKFGELKEVDIKHSDSGRFHKL